MKSIKTTILLCISQLIMAQAPLTINRMSRQALDYKTYNEQAGLWKSETVKKPKNAAAWQNYYYAMRYANMTDPMGPNKERSQSMKNAIVAMQKNIPNTIEYVRCKLFDSNLPENDPEKLALLKKGLLLSPNDDCLLENMINISLTDGEADKLKEYCTRLYNSGVCCYPVMEYNYNMLMSVDKNAILFTNGDNDSYPAWMLQEVKSIRKDVSVINLSLAQIPSYLKKMLKQKNIVLPDNVIETAKKSESEFIKGIVLAIKEKYPSVPIFFAITCGIDNLFEDSLYCTGLANQFSVTRMDNMSKLKTNVETKFHLDYLTNELISYDPLNKELVENFKCNYFVTFGMLYRHYKSMNESNSRMEFYKDFCMENAAKRGKEKEMKQFLDGN